MAFTITTPLRGVMTINTTGGIPRQVVFVSVTGDGATYAAGGFALTAATYGLTAIDYVIPLGAGAVGAAGAGLVATWDATNAKVKLWKGAGSAVFTEAAGADFASTVVCQLLVIGQ